MTRKVIKLDFTNEFSFFLAGIISGARDYRLCYELNAALRLNFKRFPDVVVSAGKPGSSTRHSHYRTPGRNNEVYHVISNRDKDGTGFFIPEMKNIDYFFLADNTPSGFEFVQTIKSIRSMELVDGIYELDPNELKSAESSLILTEE